LAVGIEGRPEDHVEVTRRRASPFKSHVEGNKPDINLLPVRMVEVRQSTRLILKIRPKAQRPIFRKRLILEMWLRLKEDGKT
jgi:hypothetical protein